MLTKKYFRITTYFNFLMQTAPAEEVQEEVEGLFSRADIQDLQPSVGQLASTLVSRSLADPAFYTPSTLAQLVHTQSLCHRSVRHGNGIRMMLFLCVSVHNEFLYFYTLFTLS